MGGPTTSNSAGEVIGKRATRVILVPVDFSPHSQAALEYASQLAFALQGRLLILHVYKRAKPDRLDNLGSQPEWLEAAERLGKFRPTIGDVPYAEKLVCGAVVDRILEVAQDEQVALIVMGAHGRRRLSRSLIGGVTEAVVRRATCPVAIVKLPGKQS